MTTYKVNSIGTIYNNEKGAFIQLVQHCLNISD